MDPSTLIAQGGLGVTVLVLLYWVKQLLADNRLLRKQMRADQAAMLPALTKCTEALQTAMEENIRSRALAERERQ